MLAKWVIFIGSNSVCQDFQQMGWEKVHKWGSAQSSQFKIGQPYYEECKQLQIINLQWFMY